MMKPIQNNLAGEAVGYLNSIVQQGHRQASPDLDGDGQLMWLVDLAARGDKGAMGLLHDLSRPYYDVAGSWHAIQEFLDAKTSDQ